MNSPQKGKLMKNTYIAEREGTKMNEKSTVNLSKEYFLM
jgi:hypothetical protein